MIQKFFFASIGVKVQDFIMKAMAPALEAASKVIPTPISEILDVHSIAEDSIEEALSENISSVVDGCFIKPYVSAWSDLTF